MDSSGDDPRKRQRNSLVQSRESVESSVRGGVENSGGSVISISSNSSKRYNPKAYTACETCRLKKVKCNEGQPTCSYCAVHGFRCDYRLRPMTSQEQTISVLSRRLAHMEETLQNVLQSRHKPETHEARTVNGWANANTPAATPPPLKTPDSLFQLSTDQASLNLLSGSAVMIDGPANNYGTPDTISDESAVKSLYLEKTPFTCEEDLPPLSDIVGQTEETKPSDIPSFLEYYLEHSCPMYPVMCDPSAHSVSGSVVVQGFGEDIETCFTLLIVALSKAYKYEGCSGSGISDFRRATQLLNRLSVRFSLKHVQSHVLSAIFLLKKGRLLDFWRSLHTGCSTLYIMIRRDQASGAKRSLAERNNIRRIYWICYNLERDVKNEIDDTLPRIPLHELEDSLPLPLGCDELDLSHLPVRARTTLTFFLAEMSLKAICERILTTPDLDFCIQETENRGAEVSPLLQELRRQLDEWIEKVPAFLGWSSEPTKGVLSPLGMRVKLMYWFVRFSLFRPLILRVLHDPDSLFPMIGWTLFHEGLQAGITLINVSILEQSDIDIIMGNRILSAICLMKETITKGHSPIVRDENINTVLQVGIDMLRKRLAGKSEWMKCRLYGL